MDRPGGLLDVSDKFVLSSGTVPIDIPKGLVLLLYFRPKGEYILPKGRKNVGETLGAAAVREALEESGFECRLFNHQLPTKAQQLKDSHHIEPIAVQQRIHQGVRKIIFWYISEVDSSTLQMPDTQEEGEDFDVEWVRMDDAPSKCSFVEDGKIVEKALEAVPRLPLMLSPPVSELRDAHLSVSVDRYASSFLFISLGGVGNKQPTGTAPYEIEDDTDWDGFGILETKGIGVRLIRDFRAKPCAMLRIEKQECPLVKVMDLLTILSEGCIGVHMSGSLTSIFVEPVML